MVISGNVSVAANARSKNVVADDAYAFLPKQSLLRFYLTADAVGLEADVLMGGTSVAQAALVSGINRFPIRPDDLLLEVSGKKNERIFLQVLNTTVGAIVFNWLIDIL